jgi:DNA polymerase sigma
MYVPMAGTRCELTVGNGCAVFKAKVLRQLTLVDPRFQQLVLLVRAWARRQEILDSSHGLLNYPSIILMVCSSPSLNHIYTYLVFQSRYIASNLQQTLSSFQAYLKIFNFPCMAECDEVERGEARWCGAGRDRVVVRSGRRGKIS